MGMRGQGWGHGPTPKVKPGVSQCHWTICIPVEEQDKKPQMANWHHNFHSVSLRDFPVIVSLGSYLRHYLSELTITLIRRVFCVREDGQVEMFLMDYRKQRRGLLK